MSQNLKQPQQNKTSSKPAKQEEQKVNEPIAESKQNNDQGQRTNNYKGKNYKPRDNAPSQKELLGVDLKKSKRDYDTYVKRPRIEREDYSKLVITLETEIPEIPKKNQKIQKPDDEAHLKVIEKIGDQIDDNYDKIQKFIEDLRTQVRKNQSQGKTNQDPLRDVVKNKSEQKKALYDVFNGIKEKFNAIKEKLDECTNQAQTYKSKMKTTMSKDELVRELNYLQDQQKHGSISIQEEKVIIKQISELQKSLPYAEPLQALNEQIKKLKAEKDVFSKQLKEQGDKIKEVKGVIQESYDTLNSLKSEKDKFFTDIQPAINTKKTEVLPIIEKLKEEKKLKKEAHYQLWVDYEAQEQLIKKIEFMKKRKAYLQRKQLEELETQAAQDKLKEELSQINENPYKEEISLCQLLQDYCIKLQPAQVQQQKEVVQKVDIQDTLKTDAWKKEKVTEISFKRDEELNEFAITSKKGQKKQKKTNQPTNQQNTEQSREVLLNHKIEILQWFEQLSIAVPLLQKQLDDTVKSLAQKKKYFEELPSDEITGYMKPSSKEEDEENEKKKKNKKSKKTQDTYNVVEEDFPDMQ